MHVHVCAMCAVEAHRALLHFNIGLFHRYFKICKVPKLDNIVLLHFITLVMGLLHGYYETVEVHIYLAITLTKVNKCWTARHLSIVYTCEINRSD
jgi:hypothetical protein